MRLAGRLWKSGRLWLIEVPMLDVASQGRTRKEALAMIADAIETLVNRPGFRVEVHAGPGDRFEVGAAEAGTLVALLLRRQRQMRGLSLADVAARLRQSSKNAYARYEQGRTVPTLDKLTELLAAIDAERDLVLEESRVG